MDKTTDMSYAEDNEGNTRPAILVKCHYCDATVGYLIIKKGGFDSQVDLLRMLADYKAHGVCEPCAKERLQIRLRPDIDERFQRVESNR